MAHFTTSDGVRIYYESHGTGDLRSYIREDVAIEIRHDNDVESLRSVGQLGRSNIHDPVLFLEFRVLSPDLIENLME